jgi:predicted nuclease with TOPRIM domain
LEKKSAAASAELSALNKRIDEIDGQQKEISELQKQIGVYSKTRAVYEAYRKSGWKRSYYDEHTADIVAHRAAKKYFDAQNLGGKLPPIATLKQEWATLNSEKKLLWNDYHRLKDKARELAIALGNTRQILGIEKGGQPAETERETPHKIKRHDAER